MWTGRTVAILASGPSMSAEVAQQVRDSSAFAIAINTTYKLAPWADMLYAADVDWWKEHGKAPKLAEFSGLKVSCQSVTPGVLVLRNTGITGFDDDPGAVRTGSNSAYQALHIAAQAGASKVILCGCDMHGGHWHGPHPEPLKNTSAETYAKFLRRFATIAEPLKKRGVDVVNCTPGSALECFRFGDLAQELAT